MAYHRKIGKNEIAGAAALVIVSFSLLGVIKSARENGERCLDTRIFGQDVKFDDPCVLDRIRSLLVPPSKEGYQLKNPEVPDPSQGQSRVVLHHYKDKKNGFFIEAGAFNGEINSNTLYLERTLNWTGILVEGDPINFALLKTKKRKAWLLPACLSPFEFPARLNFDTGMYLMSRIVPREMVNETTSVECYPINSILLALNCRKVDYFSLDVEGSELEVLKRINWNFLDIGVLSVEHTHIPEGRLALKTFMEGFGYTMVKWLKGRYVDDYMFVMRDFS